MKSGLMQIQTTLETREDALSVARLLVTESLAACVQVIGPITSVYRWEDGLQEAEEWLCLAKITEARYPLVEERILEAHPYDVPEVIALPIVGVSRTYREWVELATSL